MSVRSIGGMWIMAAPQDASAMAKIDGAPGAGIASCPSRAILRPERRAESVVNACTSRRVDSRMRCRATCFRTRPPGARRTWRLTRPCSRRWPPARQAAYLRSYGWTTPTLSLGYFQRLAEVQSDPRWQSVPLVRRLTGGGAIWHHHEVTYALVVPAGHPLARPNTGLYRAVHAAIVNALVERGIRANRRARAARAIGRGENDRYYALRTRSGGYRIRGVKLVGSAQRRRGGAILQHGSVLLARSSRSPGASWCLRCGGRFRRSPQDWSDRLLQRIPAALGLRPEAVGVSDAVRDRAHELEQATTATAAWTRSRSERPRAPGSTPGCSRRGKGRRSRPVGPEIPLELGSWISERISYNEAFGRGRADPFDSMISPRFGSSRRSTNGEQIRCQRTVAPRRACHDVLMLSGLDSVQGWVGATSGSWCSPGSVRPDDAAGSIRSECLGRRSETWFVSTRISVVEDPGGRDGSHESATGCRARQARGEGHPLGRAEFQDRPWRNLPPPAEQRTGESRARRIHHRRGDSVVVRDLGSRNGTLVNGKALTAEACQLKDRDLVQVGPLDLRGLDLGCTRAGHSAAVAPAAPPAPKPEAHPTTSRATTSIRGWSAKAPASPPTNRRPSTAATRSRSPPSRTPQRLAAHHSRQPPSLRQRRRIRAPGRGRGADGPRRPRPPMTSEESGPRSSTTIAARTTRPARRGRRGGGGPRGDSSTNPTPSTPPRRPRKSRPSRAGRSRQAAVQGHQRRGQRYPSQADGTPPRVEVG